MQVLSPQIAALFPADCALLRAERCQRTRRPQIMTKQSRTRSRVQQQQDWKNHLISWRFSSAWHRIGNDCHKTLNRFWRHSDLIEVKDGRYESHGRGSTNSKAAGRGSKPTALPFPYGAIFERPSEGRRRVFEPASISHERPCPSAIRLKRADARRSDQERIQLRPLTFYG